MGLRKWIFICLLILGRVGLANEGGEAKEGEKSEKKDPAAALPEWVGLQSRLQGLRAKIAAKDHTVRELIKDIQEGDPKKSHESAGELKKEHRELREMIEDYNRQLSVLKYRFPEKGLKEEERYKRIDSASLEEMEKQVGMEGRLKAVTSKVRRQYGGGEPSVEAPKKKEEAPLEYPKITEPPVLAK